VQSPLRSTCSRPLLGSSGRSGAVRWLRAVGGSEELDEPEFDDLPSDEDDLEDLDPDTEAELEAYAAEVGEGETISHLLPGDAGGALAEPDEAGETEDRVLLLRRAAALALPASRATGSRFRVGSCSSPRWARRTASRTASRTWLRATTWS
jgi:hypothetical protein